MRFIQTFRWELTRHWETTSGGMWVQRQVFCEILASNKKSNEGFKARTGPKYSSFRRRYHQGRQGLSLGSALPRWEEWSGIFSSGGNVHRFMEEWDVIKKDDCIGVDHFTLRGVCAERSDARRQ